MGKTLLQCNQGAWTGLLSACPNGWVPGFCFTTILPYHVFLLWLDMSHVLTQGSNTVQNDGSFAGTVTSGSPLRILSISQISGCSIRNVSDHGSEKLTAKRWSKRNQKKYVASLPWAFSRYFDYFEGPCYVGRKALATQDHTRLGSGFKWLHRTSLSSTPPS
jgi:hypothetical protein